MRLLIKLLLFSIITFSCNATKKGFINNDNLLVSMEKTECKGKCPVYSIKIYQDGRVILTGTKNFKKIGVFSKHLSINKIKIIDKAFSDSNFFNFENEFTNKITDLPTTYISYTKDSKTKRIRDYYGAPSELKRLEEMIETIATNEKGWQHQ